MRIGCKMLVLTNFLRKGKFSRKDVMANHVKKKFPLSETFQEFQIQLGDIRKKLKSNLKSPPTFLLLFLQSDYCSWSTYWQIFQKWAIICLKNTFLVMMELFFLKNGFATTPWKEPKCSYFSLTSVGLKFHAEILLGIRKFRVGSTISKLRHLLGEVLGHCKAAGQAWSKCALLPFTFVFHFRWWHHISTWRG